MALSDVNPLCNQAIYCILKDLALAITKLICTPLVITKILCWLPIKAKLPLLPQCKQVFMILGQLYTTTSPGYCVSLSLLGGGTR